MRSLTWTQVGVQRRADYFSLFYFIFLQCRCWRTKESWSYPGIILVIFYCCFYQWLSSRFDAADSEVLNEHQHLCFIRAVSLIFWCFPGSDTIFINTPNSVVSFPSFSLISSSVLPADVGESASSGLQEPSDPWCDSRFLPQPLIQFLRSQRVCKTHRLFPNI